MMTKLLLSLAIAGTLLAQDRYKGPRPPKSDIPYLLHANQLVETDSSEAQESKNKNDTVYTVPGAAAKARTPLAEPIFLIAVDKLSAEKLSCYRMETKGSSRQLVLPMKAGKNAPKPLRMNVTRVADGLYRVELAETLANGEYTLSPEGSNQVFSFAVY
ncbi:MAG: hypothetical protein K2X03_25605 [Bryobacteraceae bacterium]|nr:hypothetical protein [Bryobacteraceae bacterium]